MKGKKRAIRFESALHACCVLCCFTALLFVVRKEVDHLFSLILQI